MQKKKQNKTYAFKMMKMYEEKTKTEKLWKKKKNRICYARDVRRTAFNN